MKKDHAASKPGRPKGGQAK